MQAGRRRSASTTMERDELILSYLGCVPKIAGHLLRHLPRSINCDDLVGAGMLGLIHAATDYNPKRGVKFKTYAEARIKGYMLDSLRALDWMPRTERRKWKALRAARLDLEQMFGRSPTLDEVAHAARLARPAMDKILLRNVIPVTQEDIAWVVESKPDPLAHAMGTENAALLVRALEHLSRQERLVVQLYYWDGLEMPKIGQVLGVGCSRVSQLHTAAMAAIRRWYGKGSHAGCAGPHARTRGRRDAPVVHQHTRQG